MRSKFKFKFVCVYENTRVSVYGTKSGLKRVYF